MSTTRNSNPIRLRIPWDTEMIGVVLFYITIFKAKKSNCKLTYDMIAAAINKRYGYRCTRNMVSSVVSRLKANEYEKTFGEIVPIQDSYWDDLEFTSIPATKKKEKISHKKKAVPSLITTATSSFSEELVLRDYGNSEEPYTPVDDDIIQNGGVSSEFLQSLIPLPGMCRYPIDIDDRGVITENCSSTRRDANTSYCEEHHKVCYIPLKQGRSRSKMNWKRPS